MCHNIHSPPRIHIECQGSCLLCVRRMMTKVCDRHLPRKCQSAPTCPQVFQTFPVPPSLKLYLGHVLIVCFSRRHSYNPAVGSIYFLCLHVPHDWCPPALQSLIHKYPFPHPGKEGDAGERCEVIGAAGWYEEVAGGQMTEET